MIIGRRIKEERERLGYSQTDFAALGNVSKGSQIAWEKGTAFPNAAVLAAWAAAGVDVSYVVTGDSSDLKGKALWHMLQVIQDFLKIATYGKELGEAIQLAYDEVKASWKSGINNNKADAAILALLRKSPVLVLDYVLFEDMLEKLEFVLEAKKLTLSSSSKARAIMHLYKAVQTGGQRVELKLVETAIEAAL